jgi:hypothetical protein
MYQRRTRCLWLASLTLAVAACSTVRYSADYDRQAEFARLRTYDWVLPTEDEQAALERISPFLERRLQRAVEQELAEGGFVRVTDGDPDFWVSVYPVVPSRDDPAWGRGARRGPRLNVTVGFAVGFGRPYRYGYGYPYYGFQYPYFGYPHFVMGGYPFFAFTYSPFGYPAYRLYPGFAAGYYPGGGYAYSGAALDGLQPGTLIVDVIDVQADALVWRGWAEGAFLEAPPADKIAEYVDEVVAKIMKGFPPPTESQ